MSMCVHVCGVCMCCIARFSYCRFTVFGWLPTNEQKKYYLLHILNTRGIFLPFFVCELTEGWERWKDMPRFGLLRSHTGYMGVRTLKEANKLERILSDCIFHSIASYATPWIIISKESLHFLNPHSFFHSYRGKHSIFGWMNAYGCYYRRCIYLNKLNGISTMSR